MDRPLIVETVMAESLEGLRAARDRATEADIVELRLDGLATIDVAGALEGRRLPVIVTCRPTWEGGAFDGGEDARRAVLIEAVRLGAEYVDVERRAGWIPDTSGTASRLILSDHDFEGVPADLSARVRAMRATPAALVKVAVTALRGIDCVALQSAVEGATPVVAIAMGEAGYITRLLPMRFGSCWTYAGSAVSGQLSVKTMVDGFHVRDVGAATAVYGIATTLVSPLASCAMHNAAFRARGIDAVSVPIHADRADDAMAICDAIGAQGLTVIAASDHVKWRRDAQGWVKLA